MQAQHTSSSRCSKNNSFDLRGIKAASMEKVCHQHLFYLSNESSLEISGPTTLPGRPQEQRHTAVTGSERMQRKDQKTTQSSDGGGIVDAPYLIQPSSRAQQGPQYWGQDLAKHVLPVHRRTSKLLAVFGKPLLEHMRTKKGPGFGAPPCPLDPAGRKVPLSG